MGRVINHKVSPKKVIHTKKKSSFKYALKLSNLLCLDLDYIVKRKKKNHLGSFSNKNDE